MTYPFFVPSLNNATENPNIDPGVPLCTTALFVSMLKPPTRAENIKSQHQHFFHISTAVLYIFKRIVPLFHHTNT